MSSCKHKLSAADLVFIGQKTEGYSSADLSSLVKDVAMQPLRDISPSNILSMDSNNLRAVIKADFVKSMQVIPPSVSQATIQQYHDWHQ